MKEQQQGGGAEIFQRTAKAWRAFRAQSCGRGAQPWGRDDLSPHCHLAKLGRMERVGWDLQEPFGWQSAALLCCISSGANVFATQQQDIDAVPGQHAPSESLLSSHQRLLIPPAHWHAVPWGLERQRSCLLSLGLGGEDVSPVHLKSVISWLEMNPD